MALVLSFFVVLSAIAVFADGGGNSEMSHDPTVSLTTTGGDTITIESFTETYNFSVSNPVGPDNITNVTVNITWNYNATGEDFVVNTASIIDPSGWQHEVVNNADGNVTLITWNTTTNPILVGGIQYFLFNTTAPLVSANSTAVWEVSTVDDAGGTGGATRPSTVINDDIPPTSTITAPLNNTHWRNPIVVNGTASDPQSGVQAVWFCITAEGLGITCLIATGTTSWTYTLSTSDNLYNITSRAVDNLNNTEPLHKWQFVTYDTVAPFFQYASANAVSFSPNSSPGQFDNVTFDASANDSLSGTIFYLFQVRNSANVLIKESGTISAANNTSALWVWNGTDSNNNYVPEGYYNVTISAWDLAGNNNTAYPIIGFTVIVDNTYPVISNLQPSGTITDTTPILSLNTNEFAVCFYSNISISDATNIFANSSSTFHDQQLELPLGAYTYYVKCYDLAQNDANATTTFTIIALPPPPPPPIITGGGGGGSAGPTPGGGKVFVNAPPSIETIPTLFAKVGELFTYTVKADDPNADPLEFSDDTSLFEIGKQSGIIAFVPVESQIGSHRITITVTDGKLSDSKSFLLYIEPGEGRTQPAPTSEGGPTGLIILFANPALRAALFGLLLLIALMYFFYKRRSHYEEKEQPPAEGTTELPPEGI